MSESKAGKLRQTQKHTNENELGGGAGFFTSGQIFVLKSELSIKKRFAALQSRISGIEKDLTWIKRILFSLLIPVLLNLILNLLRR